MATDGIKNYLIDIDGTICDDIPNEEPLYFVGDSIFSFKSNFEVFVEYPLTKLGLEKSKISYDAKHFLHAWSAASHLSLAALLLYLNSHYP